MKRYIFPAFLALTVVIWGISCKSAPPAPAPAPAPQRQQPARPAAPSASNEQLDTARQQAIDFEAPGYFPSEWEAVEGQYNAAIEAQDTASYGAIAATYDDLYKRALPLYAQAREDEIIAKREEIIKTGFGGIFPDYIKNVDKIALSAKDQYDAGDYYKAKETAAEALGEYDILLTGAKVYATRQQIADRGFIKYDRDNFEKAEEITKAALILYDTGDHKVALENAEEALLRYNIVLTNGWIAYAAERRASATAERNLSLEEKVNVAMRDNFKDADDIFTNAESDFSSEKYETAAILYTDSEARFAVARKETEEKRIAAEQAIRDAQQKIDESIETAIEAERIIEGGSR